MNTHSSLTETIVASPAKINLHLSILGLRKDGYHELVTLFYPVTELYDTIRIEPGHDENMFMRCPKRPELESTSNLIYKAWKTYGEATGFQPGLFITLDKNIPLGGGLGGGSSNGATMLRWLNDNAGSKALGTAELRSLAAQLGADVPFFLLDGPAWAEGIGEKLVPSEISLSGMTLLLALPNIHVETSWAFQAWDNNNPFSSVSKLLTTPHNDTKNPSPVSELVVKNDFEPTVFAKHPVLREIKEKLINVGAISAAMSGSGASIFALFRSRVAAEQAAVALKGNEIEIFTMCCP
ncbi:4-(cytidine 5'-diphospho)-2-C-methyl-D-erythritol kinase [Pseudodesulfovibrio piezophilus]|uniref:4-diphosphocytidyl-2-C-methyl-D-erythritol kinase n=1 Tax=Pseudodesulfovibrio piezophilus (strain DSM 21447 / JCM 15486 / C1TLV30) TaxID=1322246 RepID=M1WVB9_PSEP2|nr:4-(cytidine 5'-diphospho)-2-C-methyl-D-erythritol kinase [Pseudodesulfovibrio piezophilus]CCH48313.1 4-diphosphocytidyl-2-C-methyl-D-erythritol kinase [Pseudodesulfovibrio piezophilus C1TLV30]